MSAKASKDAANSIQNGVQTVDPVRPNAPQMLDWRTAVKDALAFNTNNYMERANLARLTNQTNRIEAKRMYRSFQPRFDELQNQIGTNALSYSRGELPADVVANIGRAAATRGLSNGFGQGARGGGAGTALGTLNLRNLGLTSLDLSKFGTNLAMNASLQAKQLSPGLFDPAQLMVGPNQAVGYEAQNVGIQNDADRYWNQLQNKAMWDNTSAGNRATQMATETRLAGQLAQAQSVAAGASSLAGAVGGMGGGMGGGTATSYGGGFAGAPTGGQVSGYGYNPNQGYYPLA